MPSKITQSDKKTVKRKPLKGRTILVTQAESQSERFTSLLKRKGARVLLCPTIEIHAFKDPNEDQILKQLESYDWIVFMSQNAVSFFFDRLKELNLKKTKLKGRRIAALGKTTRESLKSNKLRVHLVPAVYKSESLVSAFKGKIEDKRFLVISAREGRTVLHDALKSKGATVDSLHLYETVMPTQHAVALMKYVCEERIDAVTFTSPSTVNNFVKLLNPNRDLRRHLETLIIATLGDVTAEAVESHGLRVRVRPSEFTIPAFVNTLSREL